MAELAEGRRLSSEVKASGGAGGDLARRRSSARPRASRSSSRRRRPSPGVSPTGRSRWLWGVGSRPLHTIWPTPLDPHEHRDSGVGSGGRAHAAEEGREPTPFGCEAHPSGRLWLARDGAWRCLRMRAARGPRRGARGAHAMSRTCKGCGTRFRPDGDWQRICWRCFRQAREHDNTKEETMTTSTELAESELLPAVIDEPPPAPITLFGTSDPRIALERMSEVATVLVDVIKDRKLFARISGHEHITAEGWTTLGGMLGVVPVVVWTKPNETDDGYLARVEARTLDGRVVGAAESECSRAERRWKTATRSRSARWRRPARSAGRSGRRSGRSWCWPATSPRRPRRSRSSTRHPSPSRTRNATLEGSRPRSGRAMNRSPCCTDSSRSSRRTSRGRLDCARQGDRRRAGRHADARRDDDPARQAARRARGGRGMSSKGLTERSGSSRPRSANRPTPTVLRRDRSRARGSRSSRQLALGQDVESDEPATTEEGTTTT